MYIHTNIYIHIYIYIYIYICVYMYIYHDGVNHGCFRASAAVIRFLGSKFRSLFSKSHIGSLSLVDDSHPCSCM